LSLSCAFRVKVRAAGEADRTNRLIDSILVAGVIPRPYQASLISLALPVFAVDWAGRAVNPGREGGQGGAAVADDLIGYDQLTQDAGRQVVRAALLRAAGPGGLPGRHHFYITFRTLMPGVIIPDHVAARYPEDMTIVLEHQFWDLEVYPDRFRVIVKFGGQPHPVVVPFSAVTRFYDPYVRFGLQFEAASEMMPLSEAVGGETSTDASDDTAAPPASAAASAGAGGAVVSLDAFRKK
jgi:uncharacterized protein